MSDEEYEAIARALATASWRRIKSPDFAAELQTVYGRPESLGVVEFDCLYVGHATGGSVRGASIASRMHRWWKMSDSGFESIDMPDFPPEDYHRPMFPNPEFTFSIEGQEIVVGEQFGLSMFCRKTGTWSKSIEWVDQLQIGFLGYVPYTTDT